MVSSLKSDIGVYTLLSPDVAGLGVPVRVMRPPPAFATAESRRGRGPEFRDAGNRSPVSRRQSRRRAADRLRLVRQLLRADRQWRAVRRVSLGRRGVPAQTGIRRLRGGGL